MARVPAPALWRNRRLAFSVFSLVPVAALHLVFSSRGITESGVGDAPGPGAAANFDHWQLPHFRCTLSVREILYRRPLFAAHLGGLSRPPISDHRSWLTVSCPVAGLAFQERQSVVLSACWVLAIRRFDGAGQCSRIFYPTPRPNPGDEPWRPSAARKICRHPDV